MLCGGQWGVEGGQKDRARNERGGEVLRYNVDDVLLNLVGSHAWSAVTVMGESIERDRLDAGSAVATRPRETMLIIAVQDELRVSCGHAGR